MGPFTEIFYGVNLYSSLVNYSAILNCTMKSSIFVLVISDRGYIILNLLSVLIHSSDVHDLNEMYAKFLYICPSMVNVLSVIVFPRVVCGLHELSTNGL